MSAFATVLVRMGHTVSGSDLRDSRTLDRLRALGVDVRVGHAADNVPADADAVIASTAIASHNPEVARAAELGIPLYSRADAQRAIVATRRRSPSPAATARPRPRRCSRSSCARRGGTRAS